MDKVLKKQLFDQINIRGYVDGWAKYTIAKWKAELTKKKIGITHELEKSFTNSVTRKGAEIAEVILKFKMYGRFVDMGVGNGIKAYERGENRKSKSAAKRYGANLSYNSRTSKRWINKIKVSQTYRLTELLGEKASTAIIENFNNKNTITIKING